MSDPTIFYPVLGNPAFYFDIYKLHFVDSEGKQQEVEIVAAGPDENGKHYVDPLGNKYIVFPEGKVKKIPRRRWTDQTEPTGYFL